MTAVPLEAAGNIDVRADYDAFVAGLSCGEQGKRLRRRAADRFLNAHPDLNEARIYINDPTYWGTSRWVYHNSATQALAITSRTQMRTMQSLALRSAAVDSRPSTDVVTSKARTPHQATLTTSTCCGSISSVPCAEIAADPTTPELQTAVCHKDEHSRCM